MTSRRRPGEAAESIGHAGADGAARLAAFVRRQFGGRRLIVVSNREPIVHERGPERAITTLQPASGLTTAMLPVVRACAGTWVAHGSGTADFDVVDSKDGLDWPVEHPSFRLRRVRLAAEVERGYYSGLANEAIWPLCHMAYVEPIFRHSDWASYREVNRAFAEAVLDEAGGAPAIVFVNDYHLALLPRMLRRARPDLLIAHFWHIPWPNRQATRVFPWREQLLDGLLGSDLLGFHVRSHCNNFLDTVDRGIEARVDYDQQRAVRGEHATYVRPFPISIDARAYATAAMAESFASAFPSLAAATEGQTLLLGVDRLDYTKGIPHRLRMFEALLELRPELRGRATFVQIGAPTRGLVPRYAALATEVSDLADRINARFALPGGWRPIHFLHEHHDRDRLAILYRRADACLVTSLHDGMNLVAKEYVAAQEGRAGVLVLSMYTGAARELVEACLINPYDVEGSAARLDDALRRPEAMRAGAMARLAARVGRHDVYDWARRLFRALDDVASRREALHPRPASS